ncbi:MAG TPA: TonB-dependent receptor [Balneolaceae bacterium]
MPVRAEAQGDASLRVLVISEDDGNPIPGANVLLFSYDEKQQKEEIAYAGATNNDGLQEFNSVVSGEYRLVVRFIGYKTHQERVNLEKGELKVLKVTLSLGVETLDNIYIEAERDVTVGEVGLRKISAIDIGKIPTPGAGDLVSYLQTLPGVITSGDRGGQLFIRGGTPFQNMILVDNLPVIKPFHISNMFSAFPQEAVQSVDMYAGGFGAKYLGRTSAVIDVTLRPGNMKRYVSSASLGTHLLSLHLEGPVETDKKSFFIFGRKSLMEQTIPPITGNDAEIGFYDIIARYSFRSNNVSCNITGLRTYDRGQISRYRDIDLTWSNTVMGGRCLAYHEIFKEPVEFTIGYTDFRNSENPLDGMGLSAGISQIYFNFDHRFEMLGKIFNYGIGTRFVKYTAELNERFTQIQSFLERQGIVDAYVSTEWELNEHFVIQSSLGSQMSLANIPTLEPRLRISYRPDVNDDQEISLAAGRYYQIETGITDQRDAGTVFTVIRSGYGKITSNYKKPLQNALHLLLGYNNNIGNHWDLNIGVYAKKYISIPVSKWSPVATVNIETALANGLAYGFDALIEYNKNPFQFFMTYGWSKVRYKADSGNLGAWIKAPVFEFSPAHDRRHKFNVVANYQFSGFKASVSWGYGSGKPFTQIFGFDLSVNIPTRYPTTDPGTARTLYSRPYGERLPDYHRLDISLEKSFQINPQWSIKAEVGAINVYNRSNIFYFDANTLQRINQTPLMPFISIKTQFN